MVRARVGVRVVVLGLGLYHESPLVIHSLDPPPPPQPYHSSYHRITYSSVQWPR